MCLILWQKCVTKAYMNAIFKWGAPRNDSGYKDKRFNIGKVLELNLRSLDIILKFTGAKRILALKNFRQASYLVDKAQYCIKNILEKED